MHARGSDGPCLVPGGSFSLRDQIIVIHGVGDPRHGEIQEMVAATLRRDLGPVSRPVRLSELNWNRIVEPSLRDGALQFSAFRDIAVHLARASAVRSGRAAEVKVPRAVVAVERAAFVMAEVGLAAAFSAVLLGIPSLLPIGLLTEGRQGFEPMARTLLQVAQVGLAAFVAGVAVLLAAGAVGAGWARNPVPLFITGRRAVMMGVRPLLLSVLCVFVLPWRKIGSFLREITMYFLAVSLLASVILIVIDGFRASGPDWSVAGGIWGISGLVAGLAALAWTMDRVLTRAVGPVLKILLDIFRYVGDAAYRDRIQAALTDLVGTWREQETPARFFVVAHSLGSVIALHSLVSSPAWQARDRVTLITMGSPIRRCFARFFPGLFFPASVDEAAAVIAGRIGGFDWINCYRPRDPVGAALRFRSCRFAVDTSTGQSLGFLKAHPNYWNDDRVRDRIYDAAVAIEASPPCRPEERTLYETTVTSDADHHRHRVVSLLQRAAMAGVVLLSLYGLVQVALENRQRVVESPVSLLAHGKPAKASVTHWQTTEHVGMQGPSPQTDHFEFSYRVADGSVRKAEMEVTRPGFFQKATYVFETGGLRDYVRERCTLLKKASWLTRRIAPCRRDGIEIRYDPADPERFAVTAFPPSRRWYTEVIDWGFQILIACLFLLLLAIPLFLASLFIDLLIGVDLEKAGAGQTEAEPLSPAATAP